MLLDRLRIVPKGTIQHILARSVYYSTNPKDPIALCSKSDNSSS